MTKDGARENECVCVCACVRERERDRERESGSEKDQRLFCQSQRFRKVDRDRDDPDGTENPTNQPNFSGRKASPGGLRYKLTGFLIMKYVIQLQLSRNVRFNFRSVVAFK